MNVGERIVSETYAGAYVEPLDGGMYISCTPEFNPARRDVEDAAWRSVRLRRSSLNRRAGSGSRPILARADDRAASLLGCVE
jgi:hypothetical protein